jgi:Transglutaminase-like enzymes, putative cysteine proteases
MKRMRVQHRTGFRYAGDVSASYNEARMLPIGGDGQLVLSSRLDIAPAATTFAYVDYWGTRVTAFEVLSPHHDLELTATSLIEVAERTHGRAELDWRELSRAAVSTVTFVEEARQSGRTAPPPDVSELARQTAQDAESPEAAALEICRQVGAQMEYVQGVTGVYSTASEAWQTRRGVCQDIVHIALGALRSVGIPARYVSGYLHPDPDPVVGATVTGESHAWVEWFCGSWHGYDPTNQVEIGDRHVLVGRGRDYDDVAPLRGVYAGPGGSELFVEVQITRES